MRGGAGGGAGRSRAGPSRPSRRGRGGGQPGPDTHPQTRPVWRCAPAPARAPSLGLHSTSPRGPLSGTIGGAPWRKVSARVCVRVRDPVVGPGGAAAHCVRREGKQVRVEEASGGALRPCPARGHRAPGCPGEEIGWPPSLAVSHHRAAPDAITKGAPSSGDGGRPAGDRGWVGRGLPLASQQASYCGASTNQVDVSARGLAYPSAAACPAGSPGLLFADSSDERGEERPLSSG